MSDPVSVEIKKQVGEPSWLLPGLVGLCIIFALLAGVFMIYSRRGGGGGAS